MDLIANMLSTIKNAAMVGKPFVEIPYSKESEAVAKILKDSGFLAEVKSFKEKDKAYKMLHLAIAYADELPVASQLRRVSKPGRRIYRRSSDLQTVRGGRGVTVVSTSQGIMSAVEAKKRKLGGEVICKVY